jgi:predicted amidohydrolase
MDKKCTNTRSCPGIDQTGNLLTLNDRIVPFLAELASEAADVIDAKDCIVVPGLIDFHAHLANWMSDHGVHPDLMGLPNGITAAVDAGSLLVRPELSLLYVIL